MYAMFIAKKNVTFDVVSGLTLNTQYVNYLIPIIIYVQNNFYQTKYI